MQRVVRRHSWRSRHGSTRIFIIFLFPNETFSFLSVFKQKRLGSTRRRMYLRAMCVERRREQRNQSRVEGDFGRRHSARRRRMNDRLDVILDRHSNRLAGGVRSRRVGVENEERTPMKVQVNASNDT